MTEPGTTTPWRRDPDKVAVGLAEWERSLRRGAAAVSRMGLHRY